MFKKATIALFLTSWVANADILTSTQRFFGVGGQNPEYTDQDGETIPTVLDQAPYSPADSDLGVQEILVERPDRSPVIFDLRTNILRTDTPPSGNPATDKSSWVSATSMSLAWRPHVVHGWFGDLGLGQDFLRYDRKNATDYENFNVRAGIFKVLPDLDDTVIFTRYEYQRITSGSLSDGNYDAQRIRAGLQKILWAAPRHQISSSLSGAYEWSTSPALLERNELSADIAYRYSISDCLYTVASARASRFNFDQFGRDDWTYGMALELFWQLSPTFRTNASVFFDKNDSDTFGSLNEYEAWSGGLGIGAQWTF